MMNRTAESLYWLGRYLERAENHTRLIDVNYHMRHEFKKSKLTESYNWAKLVEAVGDKQLFNSHYEETNEESALQFMTLDHRNQNSIVSCIHQARVNLRALRPLLPGELWDVLNDFYLWLNEQDITKAMKQSPYKFYQCLRERLAIFNGTAHSTMIREQEWRFIQSGKYYERAENTLRILITIYSNSLKEEAPFNDYDQYNRMIILLKSVGGYEAFRKFHANNVCFGAVLEFLMLNSRFPRSVHFSLAALEKNLMDIKQQDYNFKQLTEKSIHMVERIKLILNGVDRKTTFNDGIYLLSEMQDLCNQLGEDISKTFFLEEFVEA